ncbi:MAG: glycosyltransferase [Methanomassiliicoccales archaeon]|nr:MAG: glycosyltransferase [Methanomassiliicoccales archaeon]
METGWASENPFTVILPTLNEVDNIVPMLEALVGLYPKASIIVVDDNSKDGTVQKAREFGMRHDIIVIERDPDKKGLTASIMDGIMATKTEFFVVMDADFQHPPESVGRLVQELQNGNDLVIGVREDRGKLSSMRRLASWGADTMARTYLRFKGQPTSVDTMSGFFGGRTELCKRVIETKGDKFEMKGFKGLFDLLRFVPKGSKIAEVEFKFDSRRSGQSKLSSTIILSIMRQCGIGGKALAITTSFFLMNVFGRYIAALLLGLVFTFGVFQMTGTFLTNELTYSIVVAMLLAIGYLVVANKLLFMSGSRHGIVRGAKLVFSGFTGYLASLYVFYTLFSDISQVQMFSLFLGFGIGFVWDSLVVSLKK